MKKHITPEIYAEVYGRLLKAIDYRTFYHGKVEYDTDDFYSTLDVTVIIDRDPYTNQIIDITPVWWEYHLSIRDEEVLTDFQWGEMITYGSCYRKAGQVGNVGLG